MLSELFEVARRNARRVRCSRIYACVHGESCLPVRVRSTELNSARVRYASAQVGACLRCWAWAFPVVDCGISSSVSTFCARAQLPVLSAAESVQSALWEPTSGSSALTVHATSLGVRLPPPRARAFILLLLHRPT